MSQFNFKCHRGLFEVHWNTFWPCWPCGAMQKFRTSFSGCSKIFFRNLLFWFVDSNPFNVLEVGKRINQNFPIYHPSLVVVGTSRSTTHMVVVKCACFLIWIPILITKKANFQSSMGYSDETWYVGCGASTTHVVCLHRMRRPMI